MPHCSTCRCDERRTTTTPTLGSPEVHCWTIRPRAKSQLDGGLPHHYVCSHCGRWGKWIDIKNEFPDCTPLEAMQRSLSAHQNFCHRKSSPRKFDEMCRDQPWAYGFRYGEPMEGDVVVQSARDAMHSTKMCENDGRRDGCICPCSSCLVAHQ